MGDWAVRVEKLFWMYFRRAVDGLVFVVCLSFAGFRSSALLRFTCWKIFASRLDFELTGLAEQVLSVRFIFFLAVFGLSELLLLCPSVLAC